MSDSESCPSEDDSSAKVNPSMKVKPQGRTSALINTDMKATISATYAAFEAEIVKRPLMTHEERKQMTQWRKKTVNGFLNAKTGPFVGCIVDGDERLKRSSWYTRISQVYRNRYNYHYKPIIEANQAAQNQTIVPTVGPPADSVSDARIMKMMRRTWLRVVGKQTPRDIFAELNQELVNSKKEEIKAEPGNIAFGGGLQSAALTRAWEECEDKEKYSEMAEDSSSNVEQTRKYLPYLMQTAARDILLREVVGDAAIKILIAWRLPDGNIFTSIAGAAYNATEGRELQLPTSDLEAQRQVWAREAHGVLPSIHRTLITFPRDENNIPLWAAIDLQNSAPAQVSDALGQFIDVLWDFAWGTQRPIPPTPVAEISQNPTDYIDTTLFTLPVPFDTTQAPDVYTLAGYFANLSRTDTPFQLRPVVHQTPASPVPIDDIPPFEPCLDDDVQAPSDDGGPQPPAELETKDKPPKNGGKSKVSEPGGGEKASEPGGGEKASEPGGGEKASRKKKTDKEKKKTDKEKKKTDKEKKKKQRATDEAAVPDIKEVAAKPRDRKKGRKQKGDAASKREVRQTSDVATLKVSKKRKADKSADADPDPDDIQANGGPPKIHRATKKQKVTHDENTEPNPHETDTAVGRRSLRKQKQDDAPPETEKSAAPPSKRTKVGERHLYVLERVLTPPPPLPM